MGGWVQIAGFSGCGGWVGGSCLRVLWGSAAGPGGPASCCRPRVLMAPGPAPLEALFYYPLPHQPRLSSGRLLKRGQLGQGTCWQCSASREREGGVGSGRSGGRARGRWGPGGRGGWVGADSGFLLGAGVGGWVAFAGFLGSAGSAKKLNPVIESNCDLWRGSAIKLALPSGRQRRKGR